MAAEGAVGGTRTRWGLVGRLPPATHPRRPALTFACLVVFFLHFLSCFCCCFYHTSTKQILVMKLQSLCDTK